ncbi:MAG: LUD domain-containing protein [Methermicoccaceae archaeon]
MDVDPDRYEGLRRAFLTTRQRQSENAHLLDIGEESERLKHIRSRAMGNLDELWSLARERLEHNGIRLIFASTREQARKVVLDEVGDERLVIKAKSNVARELGIEQALSEKGIRVVESDLGDRILQLSHSHTALHPTGPIAHMDRYDVARVLSEHFGYDVEPEPTQMCELVKGEVLDALQGARVGITGANAVCAREGCFLILHNEANVSQLMAHVEKHIVVVGLDKVYECLEDAMCMARLQTFYATGSVLTSYVEVISGPSKTADIEKRLFFGMYGPRDVVLVVVDNGRGHMARTHPELLECIGCGSCLIHCPVYNIIGEQFSSLAGMGGVGIAKMGAMGELDERLFYCTTCSRCAQHCPVSISADEHLLGLRGEFVKGGKRLEPHHRIRERVVEVKRAFYDAQPSRIGALEPYLDTGEPTLVFVGCMSSARRQSGVEALTRLLEGAGVPFSVLSHEVCCGSPMLRMGYTQEFEQLARENIRMIEDAGVKRVVFPCAGCELTFAQHYLKMGLDVELISATELVLDLLEQKRIEVHPHLPVSIAYHTPCHLVDGERIAGRLKSVLGSVPNVRVHILDEGCCGAGGGVRSAFPELSSGMAKLRVEEAQLTGADVLASSCPFCEHNLAGAGNIRVLDIAEVVEHLMRGSSGDGGAAGHAPSE